MLENRRIRRLRLAEGNTRVVIVLELSPDLVLGQLKVRADGVYIDVYSRERQKER